MGLVGVHVGHGHVWRSEKLWIWFFSRTFMVSGAWIQAIRTGWETLFFWAIATPYFLRESSLSLIFSKGNYASAGTLAPPKTPHKH